MTVATIKVKKVFTFKFHSGWLGGLGLVVAESAKDAAMVAQRAVDVTWKPTGKQTWQDKPIIHTQYMKEVDTTTDGCIILSDGDY